MSEFSIDIRTLKTGAVAVDGGMGTTLTEPGEIHENTVKVNMADDTVTPIKNIKGKSVIVAIEGGNIDIAYDIITFDVEVIQDFCGGTLVGTAPNQMWHMPKGTQPIIEKSHEIVDGQGGTWELARVQVSGKLVGAFSKTEPNVIRVKGMVLEPTKEAVGAIAYGNKA
nr:hypothetical protein [Mucilaginibacter sp. L294]